MYDLEIKVLQISAIGLCELELTDLELAWLVPHMSVKATERDCILTR